MASSILLILAALAIVVPSYVCERLEDNAPIFYNATCSFEKDCCGWEPCDAAWRELAAECKEHSCLGPGFDLHGGQGGYMYVIAAELNQNLLQSPHLQHSTGAHCFSFHYNMFGKQSGTLNVYLKKQTTGLTRVWSRSEANCNVWREGKISINDTDPYQIVFEAVSLNKTISAVAIDETRSSDGLCVNEGTKLAPSSCEDNNVNCSFDANSCGWSINTSTQGQWRNELVLECEPDCWGPGFDQNFAGKGGYMYIASGKMVSRGPAWLLADVQPSEGPQCFSFYYHMFGIHVGKLNVYVDNRDGRQLIWTRSGSDDNVWRRGSITIRQTDPYTIIFEADSLGVVLATIAIDSTQLTDGPCAATSEGSCDFEEGFCDWSAGENWKIEEGNVLSRYGGPGADHTIQRYNGKVAVFVTKPSPNPVTPSNMSGTLLSPTIKTSSRPSCVQFWYFIPQDGLSYLSVSKWYAEVNFTETNDDCAIDDWSRLDSIHGTQNEWTYAEVLLENPSSPFQFLIEGMTQQNYNEIIAIDDVRIAHSHCELPHVCTFNQGFCDWQQVLEPTTDVRWLRTNGGNEIRFKNVPQHDASFTDSGFFLFIDAHYFQNFPVATIRKYVSNIRYTQACFTMYYSITENRGPGGSVRLEFHNVFENKNLFWANTSTTGQWVKMEASIQGRIPYELLIHGIPGDVGTGWIAIDDVTLKSGLCSNDVVTTSSVIKTTTETLHQVTTERSTERATTQEHSSTIHPEYSTSRSFPPSTPEVSLSQPATTTALLTPSPAPHDVMFHCHDEKETLVLNLFRCDEVNDCPNGADEKNCLSYCVDKQYFCGNGCIAEVEVCNGKEQCINGSDEAEEFCHTSDECPKSLCGDRCDCRLSTEDHNRFNVSCHPGYHGWRCKPDDNSTSTQAATNASTTTISTTSKPDGKFHCNDDKDTRILHLYRCDNIDDCPNGKDEINCNSYCGELNFYCGTIRNETNFCISQRFMCNGRTECVDRSDESEEFCTPQCPFKSVCGDRCTECAWALEGREVGRIGSFSCKPGYSGWRCKLEGSEDPKATEGTKVVAVESQIVWISIPMMSFFVVVILILAVMLYRRKYSWIRSSDLIGPRSSLYTRNSMTDIEEVDDEDELENHSRFVGGTNLTIDGRDDYLTTSDA